MLRILYPVLVLLNWSVNTVNLGPMFLEHYSRLHRQRQIHRE